MASSLAPGDFQLLHYFFVVSQAGSFAKAAEKLHITQPPLSRHIKNLEHRLGFPLFIRTPKGILLTDQGRETFLRLSPLFALQEQVFKEIGELNSVRPSLCSLGLTTAFEQGVFAGFEKILRSQEKRELHIVRKTSPQLVRDVRRRRLEAALVALPLETAGVSLFHLPHTEPLAAVLPSSWPEASSGRLTLDKLNSRSLFWFKRAENPAFFDHMAARFACAGFMGRFLEEPKEYEILLSRIAFGEGWALLPSSFSAVSRKGIRFVPLKNAPPFVIQLGMICQPGIGLAESLLACSDRIWGNASMPDQLLR